MSKNTSVIIIVILVALLSLNIYQYQNHLKDSEETGEYISRVTIDALLMSSRNLVWDYYGEHPQLESIVNEDLQIISSYESMMYRGNRTFSNLNKYVKEIKNNLKILEKAILENDTNKINEAQENVAESMRIVRESTVNILSEFDEIELEDEALFKAWYKAYANETGPVDNTLNKHFPKFNLD